MYERTNKLPKLIESFRHLQSYIVSLKRQVLKAGENMHSLKIALLQITPLKTWQENEKKGLQWCKKAQQSGADIVLFPEMFSNGYRLENRSFDDWKEDAVAADGEFVVAFAQLAKQLNMAIGITFLEKNGEKLFNSFILFDRFGKKKLHYAKVHTCDFGVEHFLTAGEQFHVTSLDTKNGEVKIGAMICYDREFPESARILMLKGAELVLVPNACPMEINRLAQLRGRAYENMMAIATCNYPDTVFDCNGHSTVFDGVAYLDEMADSRDMCILQAGKEEGIYLAELNMTQLRNYRKREVHGNAYRHPAKYRLLTEEKIEEPFIRKDYRK